MKSQQIQMFEEKFKFYEDERLKFERFKSKAVDEERKFIHIERENIELQQMLKECRTHIEEDALKIFQMSKTIEQKERLYTHIKD